MSDSENNLVEVEADDDDEDEKIIVVQRFSKMVKKFDFPRVNPLSVILWTFIALAYNFSKGELGTI